MAGSSCLPGVSRGCLLCCPGEHPRARYRMFQPVLDVSEEEPAGGLWMWGDKCWNAVPGEMGWSQAHATQGCVGQCFCPCRSTSFRGSGFLKLQAVELLLCDGYNLPTAILTSLKDTHPSCSEGTWVTIQKDSSSLPPLDPSKRKRSVYQSWKITVWRRC